MCIKRSINKALSAAAAALLSVTLLTAASGMPPPEAETPQVTTRAGLLEAIYNAASGDIIYVGDIELDYFPNYTLVANSLKRITISKSLTIKSGKPDGSKAVLSGAGFIISGPIPESQKISCAFENIVFDGGIDWNDIVLEDWDSIDTEPEPLKSMFAAAFKGNVDAAFYGCKFTRYMHDYGGAVWAGYAGYDWAAPGDFEYDYRDNKYCSLSLSFNDCDFDQNTAYYAGGAVYLHGSGRNITFTADGCSFYANNSSVGRYDHEMGYSLWYGEGGGAIFARDANMSLYDCSITGNVGNRVYGTANSDATKGGGVACENASLAMVGCTVEGNTASVGGGLSLLMTEAVIDGCAITDNSATTEAGFYMEDWDFSDESNPVYLGLQDGRQTGMATGAGYAGGMHVSIEGPISITVQNTKIAQNRALNAYGGFHAYFTDLYEPIDGFGRINFIFCEYYGNRCEREYDYGGGMAWFDVPGDVWGIPFVSAFGCVIADDDFDAVFPRNETPGEDNAYNYFAPSRQASDDGMIGAERPAGLFAIPSSVVRTVFDGRFSNSVGQFYAGRNYNPEVVLRLDAAKGTISQDSFAYVYGRAAALPVPSRRGHSFAGWHDGDGIPFTTEGLMFSVDVSIYDLTAKWIAAENVFPSRPVILAVALSLIAIGACLYAYLRRRKLIYAEFDPESMPSSLLSPIGEGLEAIAHEYSLTTREKQIVAFLIDGKTQKAVAVELYISVETVKTHVRNIYDKLGVSSKYELFAKLKK